MKFIRENPTKLLSIKLPFYGALLFGLVPMLLENMMNVQLIPEQYHAFILSVVLPTLSFIGRMIYQPELHDKSG